MSQQSVKNIKNRYEELISKAKAELKKYQKLATSYSYSRLGIILLAIPIIYWFTKLSWLLLGFGIIGIIIFFVFAVLRQQKFEVISKDLETQISLLNNELNVINHHKNLYYSGEKFIDPHHFYTSDLDIFGKHSLFHLLNRSRSYDGIHQLAEAFTILPEKEDLILRQKAVQELENELEWRIQFQTTLFEIENGHRVNFSLEINKDLNFDLGFIRSRALRFYRKILPGIWIIIAILYSINIAIANYALGTIFIFNLLLSLRKAKEIGHIQGRLSHASILLRSYSQALETIFQKSWKSEYINSQIGGFKDGGQSVKMLNALKGIIDRLDYRLNLIPALILNGFILWDFLILKQLSKWKEIYSGQMEQLFNFVGSIEVFTSLASWAYNNPQYKYPEFTDFYFEMTGDKLRHPLINRDKCVPNSIKIQPGQHLSIITGSNMAGKSTFLRTIGTNMILAYSGTKIAGEQFTIPIVEIISYMRIKDVLEENVSTFKAELDRIKLILDEIENEAPCFILIDEMLRGTNSKDKLTGSIALAKRLLAEKTYAMVATHDIKLAELGNELGGVVSNYYFDIDFEDDELVFDYKLKEGICENFNATFLLRKLGIEVGEESSE